MRRLLILAFAGLLALGVPARAQSDGDPPNKLSLEALTAPGPGGSSEGGYRRRSGHRASYASFGRHRVRRLAYYPRRFRGHGIRRHYASFRR